jgi:hypothetical protein
MSEPANLPPLLSAEKHLTELAKRLKLDPEALLREVAIQITREYLTMKELARRLGWESKTIKNKMAAGTFREGVHFFRPPGTDPLFKWSAVQAWVEGKEVVEIGGIPMARGYRMDFADLRGEVRLVSK